MTTPSTSGVRAARVVWRITKLNFKARLEYRGEFLMGVAIGAIWQVSIIVFASVLLTRFPGLGGWSSSDVLLIASMRMLAHGVAARSANGAYRWSICRTDSAEVVASAETGA